MVRLLAVLALLLAAAPAAATAATPRQSTYDCGGTTNGVPDRDCDGTPDSSDQCPDTPGVGGAGYGCTDPDSDGAYGPSDQCPAVQGHPAYNGCPPPDTDADGFSDDRDPCPAQAGPNYGCPVSQTTGGPSPSPTPGPSAGDEDSDGVPDAQDKCVFSLGADERTLARAAAEEKVDRDGCPPWTADVTLFASTLRDMSDDPDVHVQCINTRGEPCTFSVTVTLSRASARKLKVPAKILDVTMKTTKKASGVYLYTSRAAGFSKKVLRAFDKAVDRRIEVRITLAATIRVGSGKVVDVGEKAFTMTRKDPSGAYKFQPAISGGPTGPAKDKPEPENDF